jgi:hypothetical protein
VAQRLPERVVQDDADLLMYYDNALMRLHSAAGRQRSPPSSQGAG